MLSAWKVETFSVEDYLIGLVLRNTFRFSMLRSPGEVFINDGDSS